MERKTQAAGKKLSPLTKIYPPDELDLVGQVAAFDHFRIKYGKVSKIPLPENLTQNEKKLAEHAKMVIHELHERGEMHPIELTLNSLTRKEFNAVSKQYHALLATNPSLLKIRSKVLADFAALKRSRGND